MLGDIAARHPDIAWVIVTGAFHQCNLTFSYLNDRYISAVPYHYRSTMIINISVPYVQSTQTYKTQGTTLLYLQICLIHYISYNTLERFAIFSIMIHFFTFLGDLPAHDVWMQSQHTNIHVAKVAFKNIPHTFLNL